MSTCIIIVGTLLRIQVLPHGLKPLVGGKNIASKVYIGLAILVKLEPT